MMPTPSIRACWGGGIGVGVLVGVEVLVGISVGTAVWFGSNSIGTAVGSGVAVGSAAAGTIVGIDNRGWATAYAGTGSAVGIGVTQKSSSVSPRALAPA